MSSTICCVAPGAPGSTPYSLNCIDLIILLATSSCEEKKCPIEQHVYCARKYEERGSNSRDIRFRARKCETSLIEMKARATCRQTIEHHLSIRIGSLRILCSGESSDLSEINTNLMPFLSILCACSVIFHWRFSNCAVT